MILFNLDRAKVVLKQAGFSLTEVMVGGAILAGVGLAGARMFKDQKVAQVRVEQDASLTAFHNQFVKFLQNANNCNATLRDYYGSAGGTWSPPSGIYRCSGCTNATVNYDASGASIPNSSRELWMALPNPTSGTWIEDILGESGKGTKSWKVMGWTLTTPAATGRATLRVTYKASEARGGRTLTKDVNLSLRFSQETNPPLFRECLSGLESSVNNLQNDICNGMTDQFDSTGVIMRWNDATQECERIGSGSLKVKVCPAGTVVEGVRADGSVHCKSLVDGVVPARDLMIESPQNCGSGRTKLELVDGKLVTRCI